MKTLGLDQLPSLPLSAKELVAAGVYGLYGLRRPIEGCHYVLAMHDGMIYLLGVDGEPRRSTDSLAGLVSRIENAFTFARPTTSPVSEKENA
jgi:hypothetical protein